MQGQNEHPESVTESRQQYLEESSSVNRVSKVPVNQPIDFEKARRAQELLGRPIIKKPLVQYKQHI